jgi:hypothetical protein
MRQGFPALPEACSMRLLVLLCLPLCATACATKVYNPAKTAEQQTADIQLCTDQAYRVYPIDALAALYEAYDCLEAKGYTRGEPVMGAEVKRVLGGGAQQKSGPVLPCKVPCRPGG